MTSQRSQRLKKTSAYFPRLSFCEILRKFAYIDAYFTVSFFDKALSGEFSFLIKNGKN